MKLNKTKSSKKFTIGAITVLMSMSFLYSNVIDNIKVVPDTVIASSVVIPEDTDQKHIATRNMADEARLEKLKAARERRTSVASRGNKKTEPAHKEVKTEEIETKELEKDETKEFEKEEPIEIEVKEEVEQQEIEVEEEVEQQEIEVEEEVEHQIIEVEEEVKQQVIEVEEDVKPKLSNHQVAKLVLDGAYGNGESRKLGIEKDGYNYREVQDAIQELTPKTFVKPKDTETKEKQSLSYKQEVIQAHPHKTFKSYMRWTALSTSSPQGKLCATATEDPETAIMKVNDRYLVALGFAYSDKIGEEIDVVMESGQVIPVIVGDWKAKEHTDKWNSASTNNGSIIEFIVSSNSKANSAVKGAGSYDRLFPGKVKEFRK